MNKNERIIANWYHVTELRNNVYLVREPADAAFFILKDESRTLFIDSGLGLLNFVTVLLAELGIEDFSVLNTHAHCDHIGLNGFAQNVSINRIEWDKFIRQNDAQQIEKYYEETRNSLAWPIELKNTPLQKNWQPTHFVADGEIIPFGTWNLKAVFTPGHTSGHMIYWDLSEKLIFAGDLIYDGTLYCHMPDSSFLDYRLSLEKLNLIADQSGPDIQLLTSHNSIPLHKDYLQKVRKTFSKILSSEISPISLLNGDDTFVDAQLFEDNGVRIAIKSDDLK